VTRRWHIVVSLDGEISEQVASAYIEAARVAIARTMLGDPRVRSVDVAAAELVEGADVDELVSDPGLGAQPPLDGSLEQTA
jgi:hypothetical protein